DDLQMRSVTRLITERLRERFAWLLDLESALVAWPKKENWETFRRRWELLLERMTSTCAKYPGEFVQLTWSMVELEPLWHEVGAFLEGRTLSVRLFLKYLCELLCAQARRPHPGSHHRYANIVVAPPSKAHGTSWDCVILADAISDGWTPAPAANSVLNDEERMRLRKDGYFLAVTSEKRQVQQERILQLGYHARKHLILARYERDEKGIEIGANDLGTFAEEFLKAKVTRIHGLPKTDARVPLFATICSNRLNPELPFDEYFLNFRGAGLTAAPWHPSALETVFKTPATFAFKTIYRCQREFDRAFFRSAQSTVGRIAHRWLQTAFGKNARFASFRQAHLRIPEQGCALFRSELEIAYLRTLSETPGPDLWWETILNKAFSLALRMLEHASSYFDSYAYYQSESELQGTWHSVGGCLALDGRTDLILSDLAQLENASVRIVDFKTSKRVRTFDQENGDGLQFLGYQLLAKI